MPECADVQLWDAIVTALRTITAASVAYAGHGGYHLTPNVYEELPTSRGNFTWPAIGVEFREDDTDDGSIGGEVREGTKHFHFRLVAKSKRDVIRLKADVENCLVGTISGGMPFGLSFVERVGPFQYTNTELSQEMTPGDVRWSDYVLAVQTLQTRGAA